MRQKGETNMVFNPSYLLKSRHGLFYFRYPLPVGFHPYGKRDYIRISLNTYIKKEALASADLLRYCGSVLISQLQRLSMDYSDKINIIRTYFEKILKERVELYHKEGHFLEMR